MVGQRADAPRDLAVESANPFDLLVDHVSDGSQRHPFMSSLSEELGSALS
jgi:hypothetical protein